MRALIGAILISMLTATSTFCMGFDALEPVRDRLNDVVHRAEAGSARDLADAVSPESRFTSLPVGAQIEIFASTTTLVALIDLGDKSPLRTRVTPERWRALNQNRELFHSLSQTMAGSLVDAARERMTSADLTLQKALIGVAQLGLRSGREGDDTLARAIGVLTAEAFVRIACSPELTDRLFSLGTASDGDEESANEAGDLYVLHATTKASLSIALARFKSNL